MLSRIEGPETCRPLALKPQTAPAFVGDSDSGLENIRRFKGKWRITGDITANPETMWNISILRSPKNQRGPVQLQAALIKEMHSNRIPLKQIAETLGFGRGSVCRVLAQLKAGLI